MRVFVSFLICLMVLGGIDRRVAWGQEKEEEEEVINGDDLAEALIDFVLNAKQDPAPDWEEEAVKRRLEELSGAWLEWVDVTCQLSDEQKRLIGEIVNEVRKETLENEKRWSVYGDGLTEAMPVIFGTKGGKGKDFTNSIQRRIENGEILSRDQRNLFKTAVRQRKKKHHESFCGRIVNFYDRRLYFLADQRQMVLKGLVQRPAKLTTGFYYFHNLNYLNYEELDLMTATIRSRLTADQLQLLQRIFDDDSEHIFIYGGSAEWRDKRIDEQLAEKDDYFRLWAGAQAKMYQGFAETDPRVVQLIEVAAKGVHQLSVETLNESFTENYSQFDMSFVSKAEGRGTGVDIVYQDLEQHEIWKELIEQQGLKKGIESRQRAMSDADVDFRVTMLDEELWLRPEQLIEIRQLVNKHVGGNGGSEKGYEAISKRPFLEMGHMLHLIPESDLEAVLMSSQMVIWRRLKEIMLFKDGKIVMTGTKKEIEFGELVGEMK